MTVDQLITQLRAVTRSGRGNETIRVLTTGSYLKDIDENGITISPTHGIYVRLKHTNTCK